MMFFRKSFPVLQFCLAFACISSCTENADIIEEPKFIEIYSRLLIINEIGVKKEFHDQLVQDLLTEYNVSLAKIENTIEHYHERPEQWAELTRRIRDRIQELKTDRYEQEQKKAEGRKRAVKRPVKPSRPE